MRCRWEAMPLPRCPRVILPDSLMQASFKIAATCCIIHRAAQKPVTYSLWLSITYEPPESSSSSRSLLAQRLTTSTLLSLHASVRVADDFSSCDRANSNASPWRSYKLQEMNFLLPLNHLYTGVSCKSGQVCILLLSAIATIFP